jgi:hypothetical protein
MTQLINKRLFYELDDILYYKITDNVRNTIRSSPNATLILANNNVNVIEKHPQGPQRQPRSFPQHL